MNLERLGRDNKVRVAVGVLVLLTVVGGAYLTLVEQEPVEISNAEELQQIRNDLDGHYVLVDDVDLSHVDNFEPIGGQFTGTFDGNGHTISGLTIDRPKEDSVGLFRLVGNKPQQGTVKNVSLEDAEVTGNSTVGAFAGSNRGRILRSYVTGKIRGNRNVGGIVGLNLGGVVRSSYATGNVSGNNGVGGLAGTNVGSVKESYAISNVTGDEHLGGLIGKEKTSYTHGGNVRDSYWDINSTGQEISADGTPLTTSEMIGSAARENMEGFDFEEAWRTTEDDYPRLAWQADESDADRTAE